MKSMLHKFTLFGHRDRQVQQNATSKSHVLWIKRVRENCAFVRIAASCLFNIHYVSYILAGSGCFILFLFSKRAHFCIQSTMTADNCVNGALPSIAATLCQKRDWRFLKECLSPRWYMENNGSELWVWQENHKSKINTDDMRYHCK